MDTMTNEHEHEIDIDALEADQIVNQLDRAGKISWVLARRIRTRDEKLASFTAVLDQLDAERTRVIEQSKAATAGLDSTIGWATNELAAWHDAMVAQGGEKTAHLPGATVKSRKVSPKLIIEDHDALAKALSADDEPDPELITMTVKVGNRPLKARVGQPPAEGGPVVDPNTGEVLPGCRWEEGARPRSITVEPTQLGVNQ